MSHAINQLVKAHSQSSNGITPHSNQFCQSPYFEKNGKVILAKIGTTRK